MGKGVVLVVRLATCVVGTCVEKALRTLCVQMYLGTYILGTQVIPHLIQQST